MGNIWSRFRSLPLVGQLLLWFFFWPFVLALFLWQWEKGGWPAKGLAVLLVLLLPAVAVAAPVAVEQPSSDTSSTPNTTTKEAQPSESFTQPESAPSVSDETPGQAAGSTTATSTGLSTLAVPEGAQRGIVERVVDGDTIWVRIDEPGSTMPVGATSQVRLLEIDTPETVHPSKPVQCWGPEASAFAKAEFPIGSSVQLVADKEDKDRFGRFLRYAWDHEGEFYNERAAKLGHARSALYMPNDRYISLIRSAEAEAKAAQRGLWGPPCYGSTSASASSPATNNSTANGNCHPSYPSVCIAPPPPDLDCAEISHRNITVRHDVADADPHRFDGDKDGIGCESG